MKTWEAFDEVVAEARFVGQHLASAGADDFMIINDGDSGHGALRD